MVNLIFKRKVNSCQVGLLFSERDINILWLNLQSRGKSIEIRELDISHMDRDSQTEVDRCYLAWSGCIRIIFLSMAYIYQLVVLVTDIQRQLLLGRTTGTPGRDAQGREKVLLFYVNA